MRTAAQFATGIVLVHLLINMLHGAAHSKLEIMLDPAGNLFVLIVILLTPIVAMILLWTSRQRLGWILLTASMAGALLFGAYKHFVAPGADHVGQQPAGDWATTFAVTAWLLLLTEAAGTLLGLRMLVRKAS